MHHRPPSQPTVPFPMLVALTASLSGAACTDGESLRPRVEFVASSSLLAEDGASATIVVELHSPLGPLSDEVTVTVADAGRGRATAGVDYEAFAPVEFSFPAGSEHGAVRSMRVSTLGDALVEGADETFELVLSGDSVVVGARSRHVVRIEDAERATVQFVHASSVAASESLAVHSVGLRIDVPAGATLASDLAARVRDLNLGSATASLDYETFAPMLLESPAGASGALLPPLTLEIHDDDLAEGAETIVLGVEDFGSGLIVGPLARHVVTLLDDDTPPGPGLSLVESSPGVTRQLLSGDHLNFGATPVGGTSAIVRTVTLTSVGASAVTLELPVFEGEGERDFSLVFEPASGAAPLNSPPRVRSPLKHRGGHGARSDGELELDEQLVRQLAPVSHATLEGFDLNGSLADLELRRLPSPWSADAVVSVDGEVRTPQWRAQAWTGTVAGESDSSARLVLDEHGAHGFVRSGERFQHTLTARDSQGRSRIVAADADTLAAAGWRAPEVFCGSEHGAPDSASSAGAPRGALESVSSSSPTCRLALETDYQFFQRFGSALGAENYVAALLAHVSDQYFADLGVRLEIVYLGIHSTPDDGWITPDIPAGASAVLNEFQSRWAPMLGGAPPVQADLHHFLSGANLGGGVAYIGALCNANWGFAVSGNLTGQIQWTNWSGNSSPLAWDFLVFAHELGHNFGALHTHAYCPPLETCYSNCDGAISCPIGTLMGYCHLCGGVENVELVFHRFIANQLRRYVNNSCLGDTTLAPGDALEWKLRFAPMNSGPRNAVLGLVHDAADAPSPFELTLSGPAGN